MTRSTFRARLEVGLNTLTQRTLGEGGVIEVSLLKTTKGSVVGYFDNAKAAIDQLIEIQPQTLQPEGIYLTLNRVNPAVLARAANRFEPYARRRVADRDVERRLWLPMDCDAIKPAGVSATNDELRAAIARADQLEAFLSEQGWPRSVRGSGGNSGHVLYAIELPNTPDIAALLQRLYTALGQRFTDDTVMFDTTVHNAARIWTWYGTRKRKGDDLSERPHRSSFLSRHPTPLEFVTLEQIDTLIPQLTPDQAPPRGRARSAAPTSEPPHDLIDWVEQFTSRGLYLENRGNGMHLVKCPWQDEHSGESGLSETALFDPPTPDDWFGFKCQHQHCQQRTIRDVWLLFRPPAARRPRSSKRPSTTGAGHQASNPPQTTTAINLEDFYAYLPGHTYFFVPTREPWPAASVNGRFGSVPCLEHGDHGDVVVDEDGNPKVMKAATWLDQYRAVEQITWMPGEPMIIRNRLVAEGGWIAREGCVTMNLYRPPTITPGDASQASPWLDHVRTLYPDHADHIIGWLAHRVQRPGEKINHALVLGGLQGIGKDTLIEPVKHAVGPWNVADVSPAHLLGRFNGFVKSVILRISEARDLGDIDRYTFYDHLKVYTASPPEVLRVDEKNLREYAVFNVCGVIITTNHRTDSLYLPADDRRHYLAWSNLTKEDFPRNYWSELYQWYASGGTEHVAAYLGRYDLAAFDAQAPPPKTDAFWNVVDAHANPEDAEIADLIDLLDHPLHITVADLITTASTAHPEHVPASLVEWLRDRKFRRQIPHRLEAVGYIPVRNPSAKDGLWKIDGRRQVIYAPATLTPADQLKAASARCRQADPHGNGGG